jgi:hypothetical protein
MAQHILAAFTTDDSRASAVSQLRSEGYHIDEVAPIRDGERSISVVAPFGSAARIVEILKASGSLDVREGFAQSSLRRGATAAMAPKGDAARLHDTSLDDESFYVSRLFGLPLLYDNPAPLSSLLGIPTLIND